jgi:hypothetical protein
MGTAGWIAALTTRSLLDAATVTALRRPAGWPDAAEDDGGAGDALSAKAIVCFYFVMLRTSN